MAGEVGYDAKRGDGSVHDRAVEFAEDVRAAHIASYNHQRTKVARSHFSVERLLDASVAQKYEGPAREVVVADDVGVVEFELLGRPYSGL